MSLKSFGRSPARCYIIVIIIRERETTCQVTLEAAERPATTVHRWPSVTEQGRRRPELQVCPRLI